ncbi:MAG: acyltransferase [Nitrospira sp.]|nr:acyltransferase [Nitrospira sp.]
MISPIRPSLPHMPQLDSLRALAALGVYLQHFLFQDNILTSTVPLGDLGVRLFFVLSGFLITGILLNARHGIRSSRATLFTMAWHFYMRRFLRLLPVFYVSLIIGLIFSQELRQYVWWFFLYLQNIQFAILGDFSFGAHLWTLAVEEQFYLLWPLLVFFVSDKLLLPTMILTMVLGLVSRLVFVGFDLTHFQASMLTPSHLDTLGAGGVLAILYAQRRTLRARYSRNLWLFFFTGLTALFVVLLAKLTGFPSTVEFILGGLGAGLFFMWVIGNAAIGFHGPLGWVLDLSLLQYLGKISYGMYVYHWFVPKIALTFAETTGVVVPTAEWVQFLLYSTISIFIAMFSWHMMENPILRLKKKFSYVK